MGIDSRTVERRPLATRLAAILAAGALTVGLAPGAQAFAEDLTTASVSTQSSVAAQHYENKTIDKAVWGDAADSLVGVEEVTADGNGKEYNDPHTKIYKGYAHSDGSHYKAYSLYTTVTVDDNGILTAIDVTSGNDTFAGKWGYNAVTVEGWLPKGVSFNAVPNTNGTYKPVLTGADYYGYQLSSVTALSVNGDGTADALGVNQNPDGTKTIGSGRNAAKAPVYGQATVVPDADGNIAIPTNEADSDYYNLVKCTYTFGPNADRMQFNTYFSLGAYANAADEYIDTIPDTSWVDYPSTGYTTNREGWTGIMGTYVLRQLQSWNETMVNPEVSQDLDGELAMIDTVSGATKTSEPFVAALAKCKEDGFIKGVAEDVQFTIDGDRMGEKNLPGLIVSDKESESTAFQDYATVTVNEDGQYVLTSDFKPYGGGRVSLDVVALYKFDEGTMGTVGMKELGKQTTSTDNDFEEAAIATYKPEKYNVQGEPHIIGFQGDKSDEASYTALTSSDKVKVDVDFDQGQRTASTIKYTILDPEVTHVVLAWTVGHGKTGVAYDLKEMAKVAGVTDQLKAASVDDVDGVVAARKAYDALKFDVRPYVNGLSTLKDAEATLAANAATEAISGIEVKDAASAAEVVAAYDELNAAAKAKLSEETLAAVEAAQAMLQAMLDLANAKVTVAAASAYTGKAQTPAVTVVDKAGATLASSDYDVAYANNTNAGTATVTVTGKGAYTGSAKATFTIAKAANNFTAKKATAKVKLKKVKKKKQTVAGIKVSGNKGGAITYSIAKVNKSKKNFTINAKTGKITVKKKTKKGTYKVTVKASAAANANYNAAAKTAVVTIKVK